MRTYEYCRNWTNILRRASEPWDVRKAERAQQKLKPYTVVALDDGKPNCYLNVNGAYIGVNFLDALNRAYMVYHFREARPRMMFLRETTNYEFVGESNEFAHMLSLRFEQDGHVYESDVDCLTNMEDSCERYADVSMCWEPYPRFGEWDSITRLERA